MPTFAEVSTVKSNKVSALRKRGRYPTSNIADPFLSKANQSSVEHRPVHRTRSSACTTGKHKREIQAIYLHLLCRNCQKIYNTAMVLPRHFYFFG
jgi:hypothetical protein